MNSFTRRRFLESSAAVLGVAIVGCNSKEAAAPQSRTGADGSVVLTGLGALESGKALVFTFPNGEPGLAFKTASGQSGAVSAKCTHQGCTVEWSGDSQNPLHCPCHNSNFALDGKVLSGPAKAPLQHYSLAQNGEEIVLRPL
ncbi:cytochrome b6-f complex iron-sulfur subunit [Abditibacterium utsteinense]|uniref:Cytochrome b6-f complex iron-sulfur subunit n=1 Tax=Abditibacterium utsteinense TaxID=1960156 RepID=A0A2S8SVY6_9BACT|nr:ubiquinol-cytochrome c reductase iron-sulfur subunit [Abditibacterium utsteinense]PQV64952.1 cytochrome b6-f complex iron-sulfur subunit [Abditibacterium utsteinense]